MKLVEDNEVVLGSAGKKTKFTIQASPKAFMILSDKLYKNKIRAVVRELITNWLDAHILNGNQDVPCEIKCPNRLDPRFIIRDFGPGMSDFQIRGNDEEPGLYNSYFASTKTESNEFIGALGLGSKSPFSYSKSFTIVSYHGGEARGYMAVMNNGEPDIRPLFVEPMKEDEKTGIEITVPVNAEDVDKFAYEISYILRPMPIKPIITGANITIESFPQDVEWFSSPNGFGKDSNGLYAVYGKIVYPIPMIEGMERSWLLNRYGAVYINFPLGELDITPSREELSLDPRTIETLRNTVNDLENKTVEADIAKFEGITNLRELTRALSQLNSVQRNILSTRRTEFQGHTIPALNQMFNYDMIKQEIESAHLSVYQASPDARKQRLTSSWGSRSRISGSRLLNVQCDTVHLMIDDKPSARAATFRGMCIEKFYPFREFIMIDENNPKHVSIMKKIIKMFEGDTVVQLRMSDLDKYRKADKASRTVPGSSEPRPKSPNAYRITWNGSNTPNWSTEDLFLNKQDILELEGPAVIRNREEVHTLNDEYVSGLGIDSIQSLSRQIGVKEFYAIRPSAIKHAQANENLECLFTSIVEKYSEVLDEVNYDEYIPRSFFGKRLISNINRFKELNWILGLITGHKNSKKVLALNDMASFLSNTTVISAEKSQISKDLLLINKIYNDLTKSANDGINDAISKFEVSYPVVHYMLNEYDIRGCVEDIDRIMKALSSATTQGEQNV